MPQVDATLSFCSNLKKYQLYMYRSKINNKIYEVFHLNLIIMVRLRDS